MSNSLAIAAVTRTLRNLLEQQIPLRDTALPGLQVTTLPPDLARKSFNGVQLNLFLYQTAVNAAWRNLDVPTQTRQGEVGRPPLALNLHFLLTAYGSESDDDTFSHRVLGCAMSVLHDHPLLDRELIRAALPDNDLADQFERVRVTPFALPMDEMSKLWTSLQTNYRLSTGYEATVVLIDSLVPTRAALPVLKRGVDDRGPDMRAGRAPLLESVRYAHAQSAARLGDEVVIVCPPLDLGNTRLRFSSTRLAAPLTLEPQAGDTSGEIRFRMPTVADDPAVLTRWLPGVYTLAAVVGADDEPKIVSNELLFVLAPTITITPNAPASSAFDLVATSAPNLIDGQRVVLLVGDRSFTPTSLDIAPAAGTPSSATFKVSDLQPGTHVVRLRVDGIDSMPVTWSGTPPLPAFDPMQQVTIP